MFEVAPEEREENGKTYVKYNQEMRFKYRMQVGAQVPVPGVGSVGIPIVNTVQSLDKEYTTEEICCD